MYLHCLPFLPCLPSEESKSCSRRPTRLSLQGVSVIAAALARQLSSLSFRLSYSPQHRSFALLCYGLCKFFSGLLRHARRALIDPNHSHLYAPIAADFSLRINSFKKDPLLNLPNAQTNGYQNCQKRKCKWYGNHKELGGRVRCKLELLQPLSAVADLSFLAPPNITGTRGRPSPVYTMRNLH